MSANVAKLKRQAAELEQKRQPDKALAKYIQVLDALGDQHLDEADIALYNRVGDLLMRGGKVADAVDYYEKAVDHYTESGFFNNAIALCNKILRNAPGRTSVYYKLGRISARKGFVADAKQNFLEYADRMQRAGRLDDAFKALAELAELCPDQEDIRLMLAEQLAKSDRRSEAIDQLQRLYEKMESEGRAREARATADRMRAIDPDVAPRAPVSTPVPKGSDLVFLDVNYDAPAAPPAPGAHTAPPPTSEPRRAPVPPQDLPLIAPGVIDFEASATERAHPVRDDAPDALEVEPTSPGDVALPSDQAGAPVDGLEHTSAFRDDMVHELPVAGLSHSLADTLGLGDSQEAPPDLVRDSVDVDQQSGDLLRGSSGGSDDQDDFVGLHDAGHSADQYGMVELPDTPLMPVSSEITHDWQQVLADEVPPISEPSIGIQNEQSAMLESDAAGERSDNGDGDGELVGAESDLMGSLIEIDLDADASAVPDGAPGGAHHEELEVPGSSVIEPPPEPMTPDSEESGDDEDVGGPLPLIEPLRVEHGTYGFDPPQPWSPYEELEAGQGSKPIDETLGIVSLSPGSADQLDPLAQLHQSVEQSPDDPDLRRRLGEALLEIGEREGGLAALEQAMALHEATHDFTGARSVVDEILHLEPNSIHHHQKRVEFAFRIGDRPRLVDAYLELADCLFRSGQADKCRAVLERVNELAPEDHRARESIRAIDPAMVTPADDVAAVAPEVTPPPSPPPVAAPAADDGVRVQPADGEFVNLAAWLLEDSPEKSTRMVADVEEPEDEAEGDFRRMLDMFKQGVAQNVEEEDHESHYDLGVAYKEMGLLDEAIAEFQKALRGTENRVRTYEALGQCFVEKRQHQVALTILSRATADARYSDDVLVGVLYLLGIAQEALGRPAEARACYERVVGVDIDFRDVRERLAALQDLS